MLFKKVNKNGYLRLLLYLYSFLITFALFCSLLIMYSPLVNNLARNLIIKSEERKADVIIVLSSGAYDDGSLGYFTLMRTFHGIRLYKKGLAKKIIFSGSNIKGNKLNFSISQKMAEFALELKIPVDNVMVEDKSLRTYENVLEVKKLMEKFKLNDALLVTSGIHMKRAKLTFEHAGIKVYAAPVSAFETVITDPLDRFGMFREVMREHVGLIYYKWKGWI